MSLYKKIKNDMICAMKERDDRLKSLIKVLVSDIQRDPKKDYSDEKVLVVVKQTVKALYDNHDLTDDDQSLVDAEYLERVYLPKQVSDNEIISFLDTLDFSKFKNKMQAIGLVTKNFPNGSTDGKVVKILVESYANG